MAFTLEDGTGVEDANAFITVEYADSYFADRGILQWEDYGVEEKEASIVLATDYINNNFDFKGYELKEDQALKFPRTIHGQKPMPVVLLKATSEYALRAANQALQPDPGYDATGRFVKSESSELPGGLKTKTEFFDYDEATAIRAYPKADALIAPLTISRGNQNFLTR